MKINLKDKSLLILIAVNLYPIIGVIFLGWSPISVVLFYVIETFIIGLFNILKMLISNCNGFLKFFLIPFFIIHYNLFIIVQIAFLHFLETNIGAQEINLRFLFNIDYLINIAFIFASHGYSFYKNYIKKGEYKKASVVNLMFTPYKRIAIQHVTVLAGVFLIINFNAPIIFMFVLIILKIIFDVRAHYKIHDAFTLIESVRN